MLRRLNVIRRFLESTVVPRHRVGKRLQCGVPRETQKTCTHHECKVSDAELVNTGSTAGRSAGMEIT